MRVLLQPCLIHTNSSEAFWIEVLVHNTNENDHLEHLKLIFQNITEAGLKQKL